MGSGYSRIYPIPKKVIYLFEAFEVDFELHILDDNSVHFVKRYVNKNRAFVHRPVRFIKRVADRTVWICYGDPDDPTIYSITRINPYEIVVHAIHSGWTILREMNPNIASTGNTQIDEELLQVIFDKN